MLAVDAYFLVITMFTILVTDWGLIVLLKACFYMLKACKKIRRSLIFCLIFMHQR